MRVPGHPVAQQPLRAFGSGIAAPSANRFGRISPTRPEHVREEFGDDVRIVLDGGDCKIGLESTIVSCVDTVPRILRPGSLTLTQLRTVVPEIQAGPDNGAPRVPGSDAKHYAPRTSLSIVASRTLEDVVGQLHRAPREDCRPRHAPAARGQQVHDVDQRRPSRRRLRPPSCTSTCARSTSRARRKSWSKKCRRAKPGMPCAIACIARPRPRTSSTAIQTSRRCAPTWARTEPA